MHFSNGLALYVLTSCCYNIISSCFFVMCYGLVRVLILLLFVSFVACDVVSGSQYTTHIYTIRLFYQ